MKYIQLNEANDLIKVHESFFAKNKQTLRLHIKQRGLTGETEETKPICKTSLLITFMIQLFLLLNSKHLPSFIHCTEISFLFHNTVKAK